MTLRQQRIVWNALIVATVGGCALLTGRGVAHLLTESAFDAEVARGWASRRIESAGTAGDAPRRRDAEVVIRRNLFCSDCGPSVHPPSPRARCVPSELPVELVSILWIPTAPSRSLAVLRDRSARTGDVLLLAAGRPLFSTGAVLLRVDPRRVLIANHALGGGRCEVLDLASGAPPLWPGVPPPIRGVPRAPRPEWEGVRCEARRCEVDGALVQRALASPAQLLGSVRVVPVVEAGRPAGFRVYAVAPGSLVAALGLRNGDTLQAVNGRELGGLDDVLATVAALRNARRIELLLTRAGGAAHERLEYVVR